MFRTFGDNLLIPIVYTFSPEGFYISQGSDLILLKDTDGDGKADTRELILSGFDDHDTHHAHSTYTTDPSGAIYMGEGVFMHTNVESPYGLSRVNYGGLSRD